MPRNFRRWVLNLTWVVAGFALALVVGFGADPVPQPQRVSDLVARLDGLEETNAEQSAAIEALTARVVRLEQRASFTEPITTTGTTPPPPPEGPPRVPDAWNAGTASDGILTYRFDPRWEISLDEPGALNFWVNDEMALFFNWDLPVDLLETLQDETFLEFFEQELFKNESADVTMLDSGATTLVGQDGYFWEMSVESANGFDVQFLTVMYACNERSSCSATLARLGRRSGFTAEEWELLEFFALGVDFLNVGKATVVANANLRACPSIECEIVGRAIEGEIIEVVGKSADGGWYRLRSGAWIAASLVEGAPASLPVLDSGSEL